MKWSEETSEIDGNAHQLGCGEIDTDIDIYVYILSLFFPLCVCLCEGIHTIDSNTIHCISATPQ